MELWLAFALGAGLCWGTYIPMIAFGGKELGSRYTAFLCVGIAYLLIAIVFPVGKFMTTPGEFKAKPLGLTFATLAGAAGAFGALFVIFANNAAKDNPDARMYIAPVIFGLAPLLNTLISLLWHPSSDDPLHFAAPKVWPDWKLYVGILLTGAGIALVLYSKEETEKKAPPPPTSRLATLPRSVANQ